MLQALIGSIFGVGLFLILADYFRVPFFKTSKAINNLAKRQEKKTSTLDIWLGDLAMWISKRLRINEFKRMQLEIDLRSAGVNMSPEMHIANSIVKSMLIGILAVPMLFIFPLLSPIIVALAVMMYFKASKGVADKIKAKYTIVLGDNEIESGKAELKNMKTGEKKKISIGEDFVDSFLTESTAQDDLAF